MEEEVRICDHCGMELAEDEGTYVDDGGKDNDNARSIKSIANVQEEHIYIKSDGNLDDGFEIVSHPMTLDYHTESMDWESVLQEAVDLGYRSHQTST